MLKTKLVWLTCLAVALSGPIVASPDDGHGGSGQSSGSQSGKGDGKDGNGGQSGKGDGDGGGQSGSQSGKGDGNGGSQSGSGSQSGNSGKGDGCGQCNSTAQSGKGNDNNPGQNDNNDQRIQVTLTPRSTGFQGSVDIRAQNGQQRLKVEIEAGTGVPDGTVFMVLANGVAIGSITIHGQEGELEIGLNNGATLMGLALGDVNSIQVVSADGTTVELQASFPSINAGTTTPPVTLPPGAVQNEADLRGSVTAAAGAVSGEVQLSGQGTQQTLNIEVHSTGAPDGTVVMVTAIVGGVTVNLGTATFHGGEAELQLNSNGTLPMGVTSLSQIASVMAMAPGFFTLAGSLP